MAQLRKPIHDDGPVNAGEQRLLDFHRYESTYFL